MAEDYSKKFLIIGAGAAGLAAAKNFLVKDIPFDLVEREADVGGLWDIARASSSVYASARLISSKRMTEFPDFPMPKALPLYPDHEQVLTYLKSYATQFRLYEHIQFGVAIEKLEPVSRDQQWEASLANGDTRRYRGVVVATGHLHEARYPNYPGTFNGDQYHSSKFKCADELKDKRVLIVGGGNSGFDIACEVANVAATTFHSLRRGYYIVPKYIAGIPADRLGHAMRVAKCPLWFRRALNTGLVRALMGSVSRYGLPMPDHRLFETHPVVNSDYVRLLKQGEISAKPDIALLCEDGVRFADGGKEAIDTIIFATGFRLSFPFLEKKYLNWRDAGPDLYLHIFHPRFDNLFFAGMVQPDSGAWWMFDHQMRLVAKFILSRERSSQQEWFRSLKAKNDKDWRGPVTYINTPRHHIEVDYMHYAQYLSRLTKRL